MKFSIIRYLSILFFSFIFFSVSGQKITIKDQLTNLPIHNVLIFNTAEEITSFQTNEKGQTILSGFTSSDIINFQHASYESKAISFTDLQSMNFEVFLSDSIIALEEVSVSAY